MIKRYQKLVFILVCESKSEWGVLCQFLKVICRKH